MNLGIMNASSPNISARPDLSLMGTTVPGMDLTGERLKLEQIQQSQLLNMDRIKQQASEQAIAEAYRTSFEGGKLNNRKFAQVVAESPAITGDHKNSLYAKLKPELDNENIAEILQKNANNVPALLQELQGAGYVDAAEKIGGIYSTHLPKIYETVNKQRDTYARQLEEVIADPSKYDRVAVYGLAHAMNNDPSMGPVAKFDPNDYESMAAWVKANKIETTADSGKDTDYDKITRDFTYATNMPEGTKEEIRKKQIALQAVMLGAARAKAYEGTDFGIEREIKRLNALMPSQLTLESGKASIETQAKARQKINELDIEAGKMLEKESGSVQETIDKARQVLADKELATGINPMRLVGLVPGTPQYTSQLNVRNLVARLKLASRGALKGQGQISDAEQKILAQAVQSFDVNQSRKDLDKAIKNAVDVLEGKYRKNQGSGNDPLGIR